MKPRTGITFVLAALASAWMAPTSRAQTPAEMAQSAAYAASHQNKDGGFAPKVGQPSSLGTTHSALKILKHVGGSVPDVLACVEYVKSCRVPGGGFAPTPGGKPDVVTTALGLMAASELKINDSEMIREAVAFLGKNARSFEEVRMSAAGLEAIGVYSPDAPRWFHQIQGMRNPDGSFGTGAAVPFATGGAAAAILRMGMPLEHRDAIVKAIRAGQRPDGGWSKDDGPSDLSSSYRIMRAMYMMHERPDIDRLLGYVARCRKPDGSYSATPGGEGNLGGTYLGTILVYWSRQLLGLPAVVETAGFTPMVKGDSLDGWDGDKQLWSAKDGVLIGRSSGLNHNEFLATTRPYGELRPLAQLPAGRRTGEQRRPVPERPHPRHEMSGYQADIGEGYWGALYDESRRNLVLVYPRAEAVRGVHRSGWNRYNIRAMGDRITLTLNGVRIRSGSTRRPTRTSPATGCIAVQIHAGGSMEVQFARHDDPAPPHAHDIRAEPAGIPPPVAQDRPGGAPVRRSTCPRVTTAARRFPVVLFLHGAGERGDDGIVPAQVGLGPAILNRPGGIPAIVVFPQARQTWSAESPDGTRRAQGPRRGDARLQGGPQARDPHRALHGRARELGHRYRPPRAVRRRRPHLRARRSRVGRPAQGAAGLDLLRRRRSRRDRAQPPRAWSTTLRRAGNAAKLTEYRSVGHNSWDRAYNNPELIEWMLAQAGR